jgi:hypothetical protein
MNKIQFITNTENAKNFYAPIPLKKLIPDWYKEIGKYIVDKKLAEDAKYLLSEKYTSIPLTGKACVPLLDYITGGYVIRLQSDVLIKQEGIDPTTGTPLWYWFAAAKDLINISYHLFEQLPIEIKGKRHVYLKFTPPWAVKTPKGYSCLFYQPEMFFEDRFKLFPAIVDTDTYNNPVSFPGIITTTEESFKIEAGTPLMVVFPFKREEWESEIVSAKKSFIPRFMAQDWYKKIFHSRKSYE